MVGGAFQVAPDDDGVERLLGDFRMLHHHFDQLILQGAVHVVDLVVHGEHAFGHLCVGLQQRLDCGADHDADAFAHLVDVDGERNLGRVLHLQHLLRDVGGLIADALQVAVDLDYGEDEAQIDGHGLLLGEQLVGHLVDRGFRGVDGIFDLEHVVAERHVALEVGFHGELQRLLRQRGHGQQLVFERGQLLMEIDARHGFASRRRNYPCPLL